MKSKVTETLTMITVQVPSLCTILFRNCGSR